MRIFYILARMRIALGLISTGFALAVFGCVDMPSRDDPAVVATAPRRITVSLVGAGSGRVVSTPPGIDCGTTCSAMFTGAVTLTAIPDDDNFFAGWGGGTCGTHANCRRRALGSVTDLTAQFQPPTAQRIPRHQRLL